MVRRVVVGYVGLTYEEDVDQEITAAACQERCCGRGEQDCDLQPPDILVIIPGYMRLCAIWIRTMMRRTSEPRTILSVLCAGGGESWW